MGKKTIVLVISLALLLTALFVSAELPGKVKVFAVDPKPEHPAATQSRSNAMAKVDGIKLPGAGNAAPRRALGTIIYDTTGIDFLPTTAGRTFGNRFNTALTTGATPVPGPVQVSGSVTRVSFGVWDSGAGATLGPFWLTVFGPVGTGTTAPVLSSVLLGAGGGPYTSPILMSWNFPTAVSYTGPSFLVGILNENSTTALPPNGVAPIFDSASTGGQGFHGMGISWSSTTATGFVPFTTLNAIMRPTGNVLTPVELMGFTVE